MSLKSPSRSTLADVLRAITTAGLAERSRQDMASAVRTVVKALGQPADRIPADPRLLGIRLKSISPVALGMSGARWDNVRSLLRRALKLVTKVLPGCDKTPLSETWSTLFALIAPRRSERIRLSRLVHWLCSHQILPQAVTHADFERFHQELLTEALLSDPEATWADAVQAWNRAVNAIPTWPQLRIERVSRKEVYVMKWDKFPVSLKQDVDAWLGRLVSHDFTDEGPTRAVSTSTLARREYQLRAFASALVLRGREATGLTSLAVCLNHENFTEGLRFFRERQGGKNTTTVHSMGTMLKGVARHWLKADTKTLERMAIVNRKLAVEQRGLTQKNRDRLRPLQDPEKARALVCLPLTIRDNIARTKGTQRHRLIQAQMAVAIELLLLAPIRIGNLVAIDIDRHLIRVGKKLHLVIPAEEVKNKTDLEFELPDESAELINWYIKDVRRAPSDNRALFPGRKGDAKTVSTLRQQIIKVVGKYTGLLVNPHLFRHIGAKLFLDRNPGAYEVIRRVLGHKSMNTTTNFYTGLETYGATRRFDETIIKIRRSASECAIV